MNFRVAWKRPALEMLAQVWLDAADRDAVTAASYRVEQLLQGDPLAHGESRSGNDRLMFEGPLSVYYRVNVPESKVSILLVGHTGPKHQ